VDEISVLAVSPDGETVAFASEEQEKSQVSFWDVRARRERPGPGPGGETVFCLAFSPDGGTLAVGASDRAELYNVRDGKKVRALEGHYGPADPLIFSPDGKTLASGDCEGTIRLWDLKVRRKPER